MSYVYVGFSHDDKDFISIVISWLTFGEYTHVVLINKDKTEFIEASGKNSPRGVRKRPIKDFLNFPNSIIRRIRCDNPDSVWELALSQVGKGYDWLWVLGWVLRSPKFSRKDKWTCAELVAWSFSKCTGALFVGEYLWWIYPHLIYMISDPDTLESENGNTK